MGARRKLGIGIVLLGAIGVAGYTFLYPKIGHASSAEIEAVLPPSLKVGEAPDEAALGRYRRLSKLIDDLDRSPLKDGKVSTAANERTLAKIETLLAEGPLRKPPRDPKGLFTDLAPSRDPAKLTAIAAEAAWRRGDRAACARWTALGLRYADALMNAGGAVIDGLVGIANQAIAVRTAYRAEIENGLDAAGRGRILALLPEGDGSSPALARTMQNEFREFLLPVILDPVGHKDSLLSEYMPTLFVLDDSEPPPPPALFGTFDPVETAREVGRVFDARISDLRRPYPLQTHDDEAIAEQITRGLPEAPRTPDDEPTLEGWAGLRFRMSMNAGRNTLGRSLASSTVFAQLGTATARQAAYRNLARAVILLRMGGSPRVLDPFSGKPLRIDPKRRIVWSVNEDAKDDGGKIGRGGSPREPDLGFPYSDHSFRPDAVPRSRASFGPPGVPPPGAPGMPPSVGTRPGESSVP